jgi:hypothetical protein
MIWTLEDFSKHVNSLIYFCVSQIIVFLFFINKKGKWYIVLALGSLVKNLNFLKNNWKLCSQYNKILKFSIFNAQLLFYFLVF